MMNRHVVAHLREDEKRSPSEVLGLVFKSVVGGILIVLGIVGLLLPIVPGLLLIALGGLVLIRLFKGKHSNPPSSSVHPS